MKFSEYKCWTGLNLILFSLYILVFERGVENSLQVFVILAIENFLLKLHFDKFFSVEQVMMNRSL